ncbi:hypothetical protein E0Z10_g9076 [Xylaria hypoxylon]|uniref:2EXR domain-containing protein n=1 Tax=Xylaria hypoxylon TaxID=37992 RepID=A0A4Z0YJZ0_9PEZI|nr:hypothetical protein E0Z10_g9076 [Xylaria hypoxylon]
MEPEGQRKLDEFHLFTKLPTELQLMIWKCWREDQPVIFHYLLLSSHMGRYYVALDTERDRVAQMTARSADPGIDDGMPLDPFEHKIRFANTVSTPNRPGWDDIIPGSMERWGFARTCYDFKLRPVPVHTWVNFHKDIFFLGSDYKFPGQLRFLFSGINRVRLQDIQDDHWAHHIRQLAMYVSKEHPSLCEFDRAAFLQLKSLRKVFLIVEGRILFIPEFRSIPNYQYGLCPLHGITKIEEADPVRRRYLADDSQRIEAEALRAQLLHLFQEGNRGYIDVKVMVDTSNKNRLLEE